MKNSETKNIIEIEGVILTQEAIAQLKGFQENNNNGLEIDTDTIANAICHIALHIQELDNNEMKRAALIISDLSSVRENLSNFKKP